VCCIQQMNCSCYCFSLEFTWNLFALQQTSSHLNHRSTTPFHNTVLLWCVWCGSEVLDAMFITKFLEFKRVVLTTTITPKYLELAIAFSLSQCLYSFETLECLIFCYQECHPHKPTVVIYYQQKIILTPNGSWTDLST
jgi:hypothetical protein